jgi:hypothetical protein
LNFITKELIHLNFMENLNDKLLLFSEGATLIFKKWAGFRLSLDHNPEFLDDYVENEEDEENENDELELNFLLRALFEDTYMAIAKGEIEKTISEMLYEFLTDNFDTFLEDDSEKLVARSLIRLFNEIKENNFEYINKLREGDKTYNYSVFSIKFPIENNEDINMDEKPKDDNKMDVEPDEEGFVEVKKGKKKF